MSTDNEMAAKRRRRDIQGLRAVAVLLVVAYHAGLPVVCGFFGVDVFFVISGFVITGVLTSELAETGRLDLARFYRRRVKRLLPALAVMLSVVAALGTLASPVSAARSGGITGIWASVFGANFYLSELSTGYFDVAATLNPLQHTWTLGVEEQFYLAFPILILVAWRIGSRRGDRAARLAAVAVVALASAFSLELARSAAAGHVIAGIGGAQFAFYASPARAWEFGAGALLALLLPYARQLPLLVGSGLGACGLGFLAIGLAPVVNAADYRVDAAVCVAVGTAALIFAASAPANLFTRLLSRQPLVWIGDLSYSWYLWHWPLIVFARGLAPDRPWAAGGGGRLARASVAFLPLRRDADPRERWDPRAPCLACRGRLHRRADRRFRRRARNGCGTREDKRASQLAARQPAARGRRPRLRRVRPTRRAPRTSLHLARHSFPGNGRADRRLERRPVHGAVRAGGNSSSL